jgi:hypothetical protein
MIFKKNISSSKLVKEPKVKLLKHRISFCSNCGWIHGTVDMIRSETGNTALIHPLCKTCQSKFSRQIVCHIYGSKPGQILYPTTVEQKRIEEDRPRIQANDVSACYIIVMLCNKCKMLPHKELRQKLKIPDTLCDSCSDRFKCYTLPNKPPENSVTDPGNPLVWVLVD